MISIDSNNYSLNISLYWGSKAHPIDSDTTEACFIEENSIIAMEVSSTIANPCFNGYFVCIEKKKQSILLNLIDNPMVFGYIVFNRHGNNVEDVTCCTNHTSDTNKLNEHIFVTKIETIDEYNSDEIKIKVSFANADIFNFNALITNVSTYNTEKSQTTLNANKLISELFGAVELGDKLDLNSFTENSAIEIPYIASSNDILINALEYAYRTIFNYNIKNYKNCTYCRIIYNFFNHKYKMWYFNNDNILGLSDINKIQDDFIGEKSSRNILSVDCSAIETEKGGGNSVINIKNSGNNISYLKIFDGIEYFNYDYIKNEFNSYNKQYKITPKNGTIDTQLSIDEMLYKHCHPFQRLKFSSSFSSYRMNGGYYDLISDLLFNTTFIRVNTIGDMSKQVGEYIALKTINGNKSLYQNIEGIFLITGNSIRFSRTSNGASLTNSMDIIKPYIHR